MVIEVTFDVTDVYISTTVSPVYVNVSFEAPSGGGGAVWGDITGTLSDQTDLQNALNAKFDDPTGTTAQYLRGDGSLATFPAIPSGTVSSVGLTMPSAFSIANSPVTSSGTLAVTGAGTTAQYIRGDGSLDTFPSLTGFVPYTGATANVDLGTHRILAQNATISSSGSGDTVTLNHSSGSGVGLNITKGGNGEGLYINKTSGSGNAATIIGTINATTLVKSGGTSSQFLKADGSVDSSVYVPTSREITINGVTFDLSANRTWTVSGDGMAIGGSVTSGSAGSVLFVGSGGVLAQDNANFFWDISNSRLILGSTSNTGERLQVTGNVKIKGSGNTSGTTALTVQDTDAVNMFRFRNDGRLYLGGNANAPYISNSTSGNPSKTGTNLLFYNFTSNQASSTGAWWFAGDSFTHTTGSHTGMYIDLGLLATSGTAIYSVLQIKPTINQTGGANGITRGLYVNPTLTAAANWRAIEVSSGGAYINTTSVQASAILQADSTTKGFLPPRMTNAQRTAISSPAVGLIVYCTDMVEGLYVYKSAGWTFVI